ncbi:hypothetical protein [Zavarzinia compransoris]|uniref:Peptidase M4 n=1 Tax=Zavarzinia compransoris TaxID=1264899 RepID=A0A317E1Q4_9PROT|nr:hypothetical protein [Zavarzinia compransoris]PWR21008.1 hypothetical protein DKG75_13555 [Zavarzinia compransoris]TDP44040.1 hypothetical protein DES42_10886 [Zavarzinia compransoris]
MQISTIPPARRPADLQPPTLPPPAMRHLRVYAFDPQASTRLESTAFSHALISLPWEDGIRPGPVNEYLEVIDYDPVTGLYYDPIDLNDPHILAQHGLAPSEGDPRFHQQMVFAVAMKTIRAFERALGRKVFWSPRWDKEKRTYLPVDKLRIYPHAMREPNAYYSPEKKALLFGYFRAPKNRNGGNLPGGWVFTALSHDIIVHETTHALLDGLHRRYAEPTSPDSLAFHEAFADIVALLLHFTLPEAVRGEIAHRGGRLDGPSLLGDLARQFGEATGHYRALRSGIDDKGPDGEPDPGRLDSLDKPHDRGAILVAAVFDAFVTIYQQRTADLLRLAAVPAGGAARDLHPDLVARLTAEATKAADHVLRMCIRALDYLPPVDVTFGEYLRAIVTADTDLIPEDRLNYRVAVIGAFRRRGIFPDNCISLAPDSLLWEAPDENIDAADLLPATSAAYADFVSPAGDADKSKGKGLPQRIRVNLDLLPAYRRTQSFRQSEKNREEVFKWIYQSDGHDAAWEATLGVHFSVKPDHWRNTIHISAALTKKYGWPAPAVEVHSVRTARRAGPDGQDLRQLVITVTQRRRGFLDAAVQAEQEDDPGGEKPGDFIFRGGATLIVDLRDGRIRYAIRKRIDDDARLMRQRAFLDASGRMSLGFTYKSGDGRHGEPFAVAHRGC